MDRNSTRLTGRANAARIALRTRLGRTPMRRIRINRPTPAMGVALLALFVSLGGVSYGVATGSIDTREIKNNTVRSKDIRNNTVTGRDIRTGTIRGGDIGSNSV